MASPRASLAPLRAHISSSALKRRYLPHAPGESARKQAAPHGQTRWPEQRLGEAQSESRQHCPETDGWDLQTPMEAPSVEQAVPAHSWSLVQSALLAQQPVRDWHTVPWLPASVCEPASAALRVLQAPVDATEMPAHAAPHGLPYVRPSVPHTGWSRPRQPQGPASAARSMDASVARPASPDPDFPPLPVPPKPELPPRPRPPVPIPSPTFSVPPPVPFAPGLGWTSRCAADELHPPTVSTRIPRTMTEIRCDKSIGIVRLQSNRHTDTIGPPHALRRGGENVGGKLLAERDVTERVVAHSGGRTVSRELAVRHGYFVDRLNAFAQCGLGQRGRGSDAHKSGPDDGSNLHSVWAIAGQS
jgi:hypothetical protein